MTRINPTLLRVLVPTRLYIVHFKAEGSGDNFQEKPEHLSNKSRLNRQSIRSHYFLTFPKFIPALTGTDRAVPGGRMTSANCVLRTMVEPQQILQAERLLLTC